MTGLIESLQSAADSVRRRIAKSRAATRAAVRVQKHLKGIVAHRLGHDTDPETNGELWLLDRFAPHCSTFVDVGANVAEWSVALINRAPNARGILVEPSEEACQIIESSALANCPEQMELVRAAAGAECGKAVFYEEPGAGRTSSLHASAANEQARPRRVDVVTVDQLLEERAWRKLDLLKIDAEGFDLEVIRGAHRTLARNAVGALQFEYNESWLYAGSSIVSAQRLLTSLGYRLFLLKGPRLYSFPHEVYGDFYHYANFVALNRDFYEVISDMRIIEI